MVSFLKIFKSIRNIVGFDFFLSNEVFLKNVIETDLHSLLRPLNLMHDAFLYAKYSIRDNVISSNTYLYNFLTVFCILLFWCYDLYHLISVFIQISEQWGIYKWFYRLSNTFDWFVYLCGHLMNSFLNIVQSNFNIILVLKIQHVIRDLQINSKKLKCFTASNWTWVTSLNIIWICYVISFFCVFPNIALVDCISLYTCIVFDVNVIYALTLLKLLEKMTRVWIAEVLRTRNMEESEREEYWKLMFNVYMNILQIYTIIEMTFRQLVSCVYRIYSFDSIKKKIILFLLVYYCLVLTNKILNIYLVLFR